MSNGMATELEQNAQEMSFNAWLFNYIETHF